MSLCSLRIFKIAIRCEPHARESYLNIIIILEATCSSLLMICFVATVGLFKHYFIDRMLTRLIPTSAFCMMSAA